jgi:hypothetical protein
VDQLVKKTTSPKYKLQRHAMTCAPYRAALSQQYSVASFSTLRVSTCRHSEANGRVILQWHCCAVKFNSLFFHKFFISVVSCVKLLCGDMEDQPDRSSAVTTTVRLGRLGKSDIRSQNKRTIYNVYKFFKDISEQPEHFGNINVHKTQEITVKACGVHRSTVKKVCNVAFNSSSDNQAFVSPKKSYKKET